MTKQTTPELVSDLRDIQIDSALKMHLLKDQGKINDEEAETWKEVLTVWEQAAERLQEQEARIEELLVAAERQCDNMAFVVNHAELHGFHDKFRSELDEDRAIMFPENFEKCAHNFVDADNSHVSNCLMCIKCGLLKEKNNG